MTKEIPSSKNFQMHSFNERSGLKEVLEIDRPAAGFGAALQLAFVNS